ncbi:hypothetical protein NEOKW01_0548 [Nematocida sp. AWRm80]|nr:hypothetical protein NEOKW01_0548 [Nematocida sp. AWRm80]
MDQRLKLNEYLNRYIEIRKAVEEKKIELQGLQSRRDALLDLLVYIKEQSIPPSTELESHGLFPLTLGKASNKIVVTSIGILPPPEYTSFYNTSYIYTIGYKSKRKYQSNSGDKIYYHCAIRETNGNCIFEIRNETGDIWTGTKEDTWRSFSETVSKPMNTTIESFFGLDLEPIQKLIEEIGDISQYKTYLPYKIRHKKGRRTNK